MSDDLIEALKSGMAYSHNHATASPYIRATDKEHILGLCALVERAIDALAAHAEQPVVVPQGWKLVPVDPTAAMVTAMMTSKARDDEGEFPMLMDHLDYSGDNKSHTVCKAAFSAMLAAAPQPPASAKRWVEDDPAMARLFETGELPAKAENASSPDGERPARITREAFEAALRDMRWGNSHGKERDALEFLRALGLPVEGGEA